MTGTRACLSFGAHSLADGRTRFRIWAPSVNRIGLRLAGADTLPMRPVSGGWFELCAAAPPGTRYVFVLPDGTEIPDPASRAQHEDVHGPSIVVDPSAYRWRHAAWSNRPWHEAVICELHPGAMGGFDGIRAQLPHFASLGITAIELMPIADFPGARNWGYDGVLPFAPDRAYGTPDSLKSLIDEAHGLGLMILLDVVYNHFGPDGAYLHVYAKEFFDTGIHTPWGAAIDFKRPEVRSFFIENALMWLNEYRFDGLRFDAVHAIAPQGFLAELASEIRRGADRAVHLVLEHEGNVASLLRQAEETDKFDAQWADDWHHCLHVLLTGETEGYYEGFTRPAEQLARAMAEGFVYQGEISPHHKAPRGEPSAHLPPTAFVMCLQNHDQIGNRALGERLAALADPRGLRAAIALLLLSPFIPMIFMGDEWGARTPFLFFTSHNDELAGLVREGRRREFAHFAAFQDEARRAMIPDPNAESSFAASIPNFDEAALPDHRAMLDLHRSLLALRAAHVTPGIPLCRSLGAEAIGASAVRGSWRLGTGAVLTLAANFGTAPVAMRKPAGECIFSSAARAEFDQLAPFTTLAFLDDPA